MSTPKIKESYQNICPFCSPYLFLNSLNFDNELYRDRLDLSASPYRRAKPTDSHSCRRSANPYLCHVHNCWSICWKSHTWSLGSLIPTVSPIFDFSWKFRRKSQGMSIQPEIMQEIDQKGTNKKKFPINNAD
jgi:hypothetical protein